MYVKYESPNSDSLKVMSKSKVFCHRQTDRQTDRPKTRCIKTFLTILVTQVKIIDRVYLNTIIIKQKLHIKSPTCVQN